MGPLKLKRYPKNPILTATQNPWENFLVFNPAAIKYKDKIHLLYRAVSTDDPISRLGHAISNDGFNFVRDPDPTYYGYPGHKTETLGIEDPRIVLIDGIIFLVYSAVSQIHGAYIDPTWKEKISKDPRIALSTTQNFIDYEDYDVIPPDFQAKNATLFSKLIDGNF